MEEMRWLAHHPNLELANGITSLHLGSEFNETLETFKETTTTEMPSTDVPSTGDTPLYKIFTTNICIYVYSGLIGFCIFVSILRSVGLALIGIVVVVAVVSYWLLIPTIIIGVVFYIFRIIYIATSQSVKRLGGIGSAWYMFIVTSRAFGFWLDFVCFLYITVVTLSFLVLGGEQFGGNVGLAITQSIGLTGMFQWGMRQSVEMENQMTSVERVVEFTNVEPEPAVESPPGMHPYICA